MQPPEFDFRLTPNNGHSEAHAGLPVLTQSGSKVDRHSRSMKSTGATCSGRVARQFAGFQQFDSQGPDHHDHGHMGKGDAPVHYRFATQKIQDQS